MSVSTNAPAAQLYDFGTAAPITAAPLQPAQLPQVTLNAAEAFGSPYLRREARFIALTRALRHLTAAALANPAARAGALAAAGHADCTVEEDAEALRRMLTYWRHVKKPLPVAPVCAARDLEPALVSA